VSGTCFASRIEAAMHLKGCVAAFCRCGAEPGRGGWPTPRSGGRAAGSGPNSEIWRRGSGI